MTDTTPPIALAVRSPSSESAFPGSQDTTIDMGSEASPPQGQERDETERGSVVDVDRAIQDFDQLKSSMKDVHEGQSTHAESGGEEQEDDTEIFAKMHFEDRVRRGQEVGHKHKKMGVVVKELTVIGMGADASIIPDNLDIIKALWPPNWCVFPSFNIF
jgi:hypothetical protein